jgi:transcription antitermination factor NusG
MALHSSLGLTVCLSRFKDGNDERMKSVFPGYLFVQANLQVVPLSRINATPYVKWLVAFETPPLPISEKEIEALRQRAVLVGPQNDERRVAILLEFYDGRRKIPVDKGVLKPVRSELTSKKRRGTRGKGRSIKVR